MNPCKSWKYLGLLLVALCSLPAVEPAAAAGPPDVIGEYAVAVTPETDGSLVMQYAFTRYCASTDFPSDTQYLEVGVPNANFSILDYGPKDWVTSAQPRTSGGSWVRLNFARLPKAGDCFDATFSIRQKRMAFASGDDISIQFTPGWFDFARINKLTITWALPGDRNLVRRASGAYSVDDNRAVWMKENLAPNEKYSVELIMAKAAYPGFSPPPVPQSGTASSSASNTTSESGGTVLMVLLIGGLVVLFGRLASSGKDTYGGSYSSGGGSTVHRSSCVRSSCARSSCARSSCACACAGGGRVGCSRKRIGYKGAFCTASRTGVPSAPSA